MGVFGPSEKLISTVPWDDAGAYVRFSVTFVAKDEADERRRRFARHQRGRTWKWPRPPTEPVSQPPASSRKSAWGSRIAPNALR